MDVSIQDHYGRGSLLARIDRALRESGIDPDHPRCQDLYSYDQLHGRGIDATREHADRAGLRANMHALDLGCGIGGASRYLAAEYDCRVTGVDLTQEYVDAARLLTARCGLAARIEFHRADALCLPFDADAFDHVWCHNVTMNIADKKALAAEVARVLKPGGRFSCAEIAQGPGGPPVYPLPWASDASFSFLATPEEMRVHLEAGGLRVLEQIDLSEASRAAIQDNMKRAERAEPPRQRTDVVMGDDFPVRARNSAKSALEGRLLAYLHIAERP